MARHNLETGSMYKSELEIFKRYDAGQSPDEIARETGLSRAKISSTLSLQSEAGSVAMVADLAGGSQRLAEALKQAGAFAERHREARKLSATALDPLPIGRACPVLVAPAKPADPRPPAFSRGPCPRCGTRGDLGCAHQAPFVPLAAGDAS